MFAQGGYHVSCIDFQINIASIVHEAVRSQGFRMFRSIYAGLAISRAAGCRFLPNTAGTDGDRTLHCLSPSSSRSLPPHPLCRCSWAHPLGHFTGGGLPATLAPRDPSGSRLAELGVEMAFCKRSVMKG